MKKYKIIRPQKINFCVPSCLQTILNYEGIKINQEEISKELTVAKQGFKVHDNNIKKLLFEQGFNYYPYWWNETPLNEPELVLEDMKENHGLICIRNHAYIFYDFNNLNIKIIDPNNSKKIKLGYYNLLKRMYYTEGLFGLIKKI